MASIVAIEGYRERSLRAQDGLPIHFRDYGDGNDGRTPVVCLPGITRNAKDFHRLAEHLAAKRRVICPDYRGRGRSAYDPNWRHYQPATYVEDLRHLLVANNLHRVIVIGTSLGGVLAMAMAVAMPTVLAAVVLNDIGPEVESAGLAHLIAYMRDRRPMRDWGTAVARLRQTFPDLPAQSDEDWLGIARNTYREAASGRIVFDWDPAIVRPLLRAKRVPDLWPAFRALARVPTLAVRGERSSILSEATFERMAEALPQMKRITVAGVGHAPSLGEPQVVEAIDALVDPL